MRSKQDTRPQPITLIIGGVIHIYELIILPNHPYISTNSPWLGLIHNYKALPLSPPQSTKGRQDAVAQIECGGGGAGDGGPESRLGGSPHSAACGNRRSPRPARAPLPLPGAPQTPQGQSPAGLGTQPSWQEALSKGLGVRETRRARCPTSAPHLPSCLERPRPGNGIWRTSLELNEGARAIKGVPS